MKKQRLLGLPAATSLVIGNMVGSGIFLLPATLASIGSISILGWVITATGSLVLALVFGKLSQYFPIVGGLCAYSHHELGNMAGYHVNLSYIIGNIIGDVATITALLAYLTVFWPTIENHHFLAFLTGSSIIWLVAGINLLGLKEVKITQIITTIAKLIPIILVSVAGLFNIDLNNLTHFNISGQSDMVALANVAMLTFFAFSGLESATIPAEAIVNPKKTIYLATVIGTLITALIYIISTVVIMGMFAPDILVNSSAPFAAAGKIIFGGLTNQIFALAAIVSCLCSVIGFLFVTSQATMAAARKGLFPAFLAKLSKQNTPYWSIIIPALIMNVLLGMNYSKVLTSQFTFFVALSNIFILIPYLYTSIAAMFAFQQFRHKEGKKKFLMNMTMAILACFYIMFAFVGSGFTVIYSALFLILLTPFYYLMPTYSHNCSP